VATGVFTPSPAAATLSRAALFSGGTIPVTVRFSNATGLPNIPDGDPNANPHGMAIKFHMAGGKNVDIVINSLHFFPVATGAEFRDLLLAVVASPPGTPKPTPVDNFMAAHPSAPAAFGTVHTPDSFADEEYFGVDAFVFVDKDGKRQPFRIIASPDHVVHLDPAEAAKRSPDFLVDDLPARLAKGPVIFHLRAQLAEPGDPTADATKPWPAERKVVDLGTISLDTASPDSLAAQKKLLFLPTNLTDGIVPSDDPLISTRSGAYAVSFSRRIK
jgi:catalase